MLVGSDRPTDQGTDRQTMSVIELSWTAKKAAILRDPTQVGYQTQKVAIVPDVKPRDTGGQYDG